MVLKMAICKLIILVYMSYSLNSLREIYMGLLIMGLL